MCNVYSVREFFILFNEIITRCPLPVTILYHESQSLRKTHLPRL